MNELEQRPGTIITFYSYKGGVGRSMALANVAWILASGGKKVLVIDWDLEAPGLHRYFAPFLVDPDLEVTEGLIDLVLEFALEAKTPVAEGVPCDDGWIEPFADISRYAIGVDWDFPNGGSLEFVPAGRQDSSYASRVNFFNWKNFYEQLGGGSFFERLKSNIKNAYDFILIDSRTGVSDTAGICTVHMPDVLVVCFTLNRQNMEGAAAVTSSVYAQRGRSGMKILPVPMRVELGEKEKLEQARDYSRAKFAAFLGHIPMSLRADYWGDVEVIYHQYYAYEEVLATFGDKAGTKISILAALERLCGYVSGGEVGAFSHPQEYQRQDVLARYSLNPERHETVESLLTNQPDLRPLCDSVIGSFELWKSDRGNGALLIPLQAFNQLKDEPRLLAAFLGSTSFRKYFEESESSILRKERLVRLVQSLGRLNRSQLDAVISLFDLPQEDLPAASSPVAELAEAIVRLAEHRGEDEIQNIERIVQSTNRFERSMETRAESKVFISYRRQDTRDIASRLAADLAPHFGRDAVFFDIDAIPPGVEFPKRLADELNRCDVLLAVIGDHWLDAAFDEEGPKKGQRRLDDPRDFVRIEIETALDRGIRVVPLLVGQRPAMPSKADLPDTLKALVDRQALVIQSGPDFRGQADRLIRRLETEQFEAKKEKLQQDVQKAIDIANQAPKMALSGGREVLELIMQDVYRRRFSEPPGHRSLEVLTERLTEEGHLPDQLGFGAMLRTFSGAGTARWSERITGESVCRSLTQLKKILDWYIEIEQPGAPGWRPAADGEPASRRIKPGDTLPPTRREGRTAVVPKGLDSFDGNDARFFLQLLPGPRDEDGLPESIRFWKYRIEATNEPTFTVGVIFGPSGCGKTSLVKAGLLPRLAEHVVPVYVEATAEETEVRLLAGLRKRCPDLPGDLDLTATIAALRQGQGLDHSQRVLIVLDQFEQWLHAKREEANTELAQALRQCDGERVKAIIMVRADGDFWMEVHRFVRELRIEVQGQNSAAVALFEPRHARKVLIAFGQAFEALDEKLSKDQESFVDKAIQGLAENGRIVPARLALFAEMVKEKPWTQSTFKDVGGAEGVGVLFLEETFNSTTLKPHRRAAQALLKALLPEEGTEIKGQKRSVNQLLEISGYRSRPAEFHDLLQMLNTEYRLITPATPDTTSPDSAEHTRVAPSAAARFYQLTHDYLVPALREWLESDLRKTRRGRAEKLLASRASTWKHERADRFLPSLREHLVIRILTQQRDWTGPQQKMMQRAVRVHGLRAIRVAVLVALTTWGGIEGYCNTRASALVESLKIARTADVPTIIRQLASYRRWANPRLIRLLKESKNASTDHLHASLALLPDDASQEEYLFRRLLNATPTELPVLRDALSPHRTELIAQLWSVLDSAKSNDTRLLPSASALALYDGANPRWAEVSGKLAQALVSVNSIYLGDWLKYLSNVRSTLTPPLTTIFRDRKRSDSERMNATNILADDASEDPNLLVDLVLDSEEKPFFILFEKLKARQERAVPLLEAELTKKPPSEANDAEEDQSAQRKARAAVALVRLGQGEKVWTLLRHSPDPSVRSFIVNWMKPLGVAPKVLVSKLAGVAPVPASIAKDGKSRMDAILFHPDTSERRALILGLGGYDAEDLFAGDHEPLVAQLLEAYRSDPDAGIHGAAEWTLRQWKLHEKLKEVDREAMKLKAKDGRRWYLNSEGHVLAVIEGPVEFSMGSPPNEFDRFASEELHRVRINRSFAIATKEVTEEQYQRFLKQHSMAPEPRSVDDRTAENRPMKGRSWYDAARYCNWLSEREGLSSCYEVNAAGIKTVPAFSDRSGYRLPTEEEWEYACRAGATTSRYYGRSSQLLAKYAWYSLNSADRTRPSGLLKPNDLGLFDPLGNVFEWCQDKGSRDASDFKSTQNDPSSERSVEKDETRVLRGGAFTNPPALLRAAYRLVYLPSVFDVTVGFRNARTLSEPPSQ